MLEELAHACIAVMALTVLVSLIWLSLTDLPIAPLLFGELMGAPTGIILLALSSPRRRR